MPRKSNVRRKRLPRRRRHGKVAISKVPFASHRDVQMSYASSFTMTSTLGVANGVVWRANNLYDPDYNNTGTDHQPFGYDQLTSIYSFYNAYACKADLSVIATAPCMITLRAQPTATTPANLELDEERGHSTHMMVNANGSSKKLTLFRYASDVLGHPKASRFIEDDYKGGSSGTSPVNKWYYTCGIQHPDRVSTVTAYCNIKLTYYVRWSGRKLISQS